MLHVGHHINPKDGMSAYPGVTYRSDSAEPFAASVSFSSWNADITTIDDRIAGQFRDFCSTSMYATGDADRIREFAEMYRTIANGLLASLAAAEMQREAFIYPNGHGAVAPADGGAAVAS